MEIQKLTFARRCPYLFMEYSTKVLNEMRCTKELIDLILVTEDEEFPVHWFIMAASSPRFVNQNGNGRNNQKHEIHRMMFPKVKSSSMSFLLDYLYTGELHLPTAVEAIEELLQTASEFEIENFSRHVEAELMARITAENYISLWELAVQFESHELEQHLEKFVALSIEELWRSASQFGCLKPDWLQKVCMLSSASPSIPAESLVQAILTWINCDPAQRISELPQFLPYLHLADCGEEFLKSLWHTEPLIQKLRPLKRELYNAIISLRQTGYMSFNHHHTRSFSSSHLHSKSSYKQEIRAKRNASSVPSNEKECYKYTNPVINVLSPKKKAKACHSKQVTGADRDVVHSR